MPSSVRIARLAGERFKPAGGGAEDPLKEHETLVGLIGRHLPGVASSLLASPRRVGGGAYIEWYSDLAGQPAMLNSLPALQQESVRRLLADRVASVQGLADRLQQVEPASAHLADALRHSVSYPGDDNVYVVNGQPVLTFWGHVDAMRPPPAAPMSSGGRRSPWLWPAVSIALLVLAALLYWWYEIRRPGLTELVAPPAYDHAAMLAEAAGDCDRLEALVLRLDPNMLPVDDKLREVHTALHQQLRACRMPDYRRMFDEVRGDCERIKNLAHKLNAPDVLQTPALGEVRATLDEALRICGLPDYRLMLGEARDDCAALMGLHQQLRSPEFPDAPELPTMRDELRKALGGCRMRSLQKEFEKVQSDCKQLKAFGSKLTAADAELNGYAQLKAAMTPKLRDCNKPRTDPAGLCPGERPKAIAPELVLVFDASGSMKYPLLPEDELQRRVLQGSPLAMLNPLLLDQAIQRQFGSMEKRVDVAKRATRRLVSELPGDVDVGLVLVKSCPQAQRVGFFSPSQRPKLLHGIEAIEPFLKTPLASGIQVAGSMVDGVNKSSLMVVISDGKETCGADPCAVARQLAASKPRLKINVVDILGTGAGYCLAEATGGRVWTATNASELADMLERAARDVRGPGSCGE